MWSGGGSNSGDITKGLKPGEEVVMLPWAEALMKTRKSQDDPQANCMPFGVPRGAPYPWRMVQTPTHKAATHIFILYEGNIHSYRQIFMNGKHPDDPDPTWYGHSIGHWEGETLVVDTVGIVPQSYLAVTEAASNLHKHARQGSLLVRIGRDGGIPGIELVTIERREQRLKAALAATGSAYEIVLIDCPPSLGLLTVNALAAAQEIIIPVQAEYYALEGLSQLTTIVEQARENLNPSLTILGVLITMFDGRTRLAVEVLDEVHRFFPGRVFHTQIPRNIRLSEAPSYGKPAVLFDPKSRGAQAYISLARETLGGIGSVESTL